MKLLSLNFSIKPLLAAAILIFASASGRAEWTEIVETAKGTHYFDISTVKKNGNFRKVWVMTSMKSPAPNGAMSRRTLQEFDCKEEQSRFLSLEEFREDKLRGELIGRLGANPEGWIPIAPNTASRSMLEAICIYIDIKK